VEPVLPTEVIAVCSIVLRSGGTSTQVLLLPNSDRRSALPRGGRADQTNINGRQIAQWLRFISSRPISSSHARSASIVAGIGGIPYDKVVVESQFAAKDVRRERHRN
jgi:hypothetical protein